MIARATAFLTLVLLVSPLWAQDVPKKSELRRAFEAGLVKGIATADGVSSPYALFVPADYDASKPWPLIVFLHGMGERGDDGLRQTKVGIGPAIRNHPERFPCLVLMPQCSTTYVWPAEIPMAQIDDAIRQTQQNYNVDDKRVSLTGLSMGGFGTFRYGSLNPVRFCAFMPVCGGGDPAWAAELAKRPMRVFHGANDTVVIPSRSTDMVEAIRAAGGDVSYTEYPATGHNSWDQAYGDPDNIAWLLSKSLRAEMTD